jgi:hypothetical protein
MRFEGFEVLDGVVVTPVVLEVEDTLEVFQYSKDEAVLRVPLRETGLEGKVACFRVDERMIDAGDKGDIGVGSWVYLW